MVTKKTTKRTTTKAHTTKTPSASTISHRFEPAKLDSLFVVLDAIAWMDAPSSSQVAQFAGIDPRTAGKLLKNAIQIGLVDTVATGYVLMLPYPYKGSQDQKQAVVKEALVRLPLLTSVRQFLRLGDKTEIALRKAATIAGISPFIPTGTEKGTGYLLSSSLASPIFPPGLTVLGPA